jgi:CBS domain-containing protein
METIKINDLADITLAPFDADIKVFDAVIRLEKLNKVCNAVIDIHTRSTYIFSIRKFIEKIFEYEEKAYVSVEGGNIDYILNLDLGEVSKEAKPLKSLNDVIDYVKDSYKFSVDCLAIDLGDDVLGVVTEDSIIEAFKEKIFGMGNVKPLDIASKPVETIDREAPIAEALGLMLQKGYRRLPVVDSNDLVVGIINQPLLLSEIFIKINNSLNKINLNELIHGLSIGDFNIYPPFFISEESSIKDIFKILMNNPSRSVLIGDSLRLKGIITERDLIKLLVNKLI